MLLPPFTPTPQRTHGKNFSSFFIFFRSLTKWREKSSAGCFRPIVASGFSENYLPSSGGWNFTSHRHRAHFYRERPEGNRVRVHRPTVRKVFFFASRKGTKTFFRSPVDDKLFFILRRFFFLPTVEEKNLLRPELPRKTSGDAGDFSRRLINLQAYSSSNLQFKVFRSSRSDHSI